MAAPITWRNVDTANLAQSAVPLAYSQQSINGAFDAFQNILRQRQDVDNANTAAIQEVGKQNFLDALAQARTPEQMAALQQSGQLDAMRQSMGAQARNAVRGADESRLASVRQQTTQEQAFNAAQLERSQVPLKDEIASLTANGKFAEARELAQQHPELLNRAALFNGIATAENNFNTRTLENSTRTMQNESAKLSLDQKKKDVTNTTLVDAAVGQRLSEFQSGNQEHNAKIAEQARDMGLPLDPRTGLPDPSTLTPQQSMVLNSRLTALGLNVGKTSSQALEAVRSDLIAKGLPPDAIEAGVTKADKLLKGRTQLTAEDTAELGRMTGIIDARFEDAKKNNLYFTPPPELQSAKASVLEKVDSRIKDGPMTKTRIRENLSRWMDDGILVTDPETGKQVNVPVPPKVMEAAMAGGLEDDTWFSNDTVGNMETIVRRFLTDPQYKDQRGEAVWLLNNGHVDEKAKITRNFKNNAGTVTPSDWLANFSRALDKAKGK